jgi:tetratricopeptide (TPR) repeat protein
MNNIMKYAILLPFLFLWFINNAQSQETELDIFLNEVVTKNTLVNVKLINSIDYTPNGFLLLSSSNQFYMLGLEDIPAVFNKTKTAIDAFAVMQNNALLVISGRKLYNMDSQGNLFLMFELPISKAGIVSGNDENVTYIYDRTLQKGKKEYAIYRSSDTQYTRLASISAPILSVFEYKTSLLFSSENKILCADSKTKTFFDLFSLPQKQNIISITGDTINHAVYFSTSDTIYRIKDSKLEYICSNFGGILKYDGEGLLVFNPEKNLIVRFRNNLLYPSEKEKQHIPKISKENYLPDEKLRELSIQEVRNLVLQKRIGEALSGYSYLVAKDSLNTNLLAEYSYALALNGAYDCALMNLDRVRLVSPKSDEGAFYSALVFSLMRYNDLFEGFIKNIPNSKIPKWISFDNHSDLLSTFQQPFQVNTDDFPTAFVRVNQLTAAGLYLQSIALYEEIIKQEPAVYLAHVGYSIVLEKAGLYQKAHQELDIAIKMMGDTPEDLNAKAVFEKRNKAIANKVNSPKNLKNKWLKYKSDFNPQTMLYVGGMVAEHSVSLDSRFGLYLTNTFNGAVDFGLSSSSGNFSANLGMSGYQRFGIFVCGVGPNLQVGDVTVLTWKSSFGLSFINRKRNSSWDIFFDWYVPTGKDAKMSYGISIGKSIYFGKRK